MSDLSRIATLGGHCVIERAYPSRPSEPCNICWRFGHVKSRCKKATICPLGAGPDTEAEHRCPNATCLKGETSSQFSPAALPLRRAILTIAKTTLQPKATALLAVFPLPIVLRCSRDRGDRLCRPLHPPQPSTQQLSLSDPDAIDIQPDEARLLALSLRPPLRPRVPVGVCHPMFRSLSARVILAAGNATMLPYIASRPRFFIH